VTFFIFTFTRLWLWYPLFLEATFHFLCLALIKRVIEVVSFIISAGSILSSKSCSGFWKDLFIGKDMLTKPHL